MQEYFSILESGKELSTDQACVCMKEVLNGASDEDIRKFLELMNSRRVRIDELVGFVLGVRSFSKQIWPQVGNIVDTCGTGGDCSGTINVSTAAAIVAAAAGVPVAKHGNYSVTSMSGSANVLQALGYNIDMSPEDCQKMIEDVNFAFLFAPNFNPAMGRVAAIRKEIGRTIFNQIGPLCNPANATSQLVGVYDEQLGLPFSKVLYKLGVSRALVVCSEGLDEISNVEDTLIYEMNAEDLEWNVFSPESLGVARASLESIQGGTPEQNAEYLRRVFRGDKGDMRDFVLLNSGGAIYLHGGHSSLERAVSHAKDIIDSGDALRKLEEVIAYSNN
jgi:anthranilate phosphoribosyltransferase